VIIVTIVVMLTSSTRLWKPPPLGAAQANAGGASRGW
jgi:hypothetical protein